MKTSALRRLLALAAGIALAGVGFAAKTAAPAPVPGRVAVEFEHPEKFTDIKDHSSDFENERGRDRYLPFIREYLEKRADKMLPPGQKLTVTFTDIDLAGDFEPWHGINFQDIRVVKSLYVPRMSFRFSLTDAGGQVIKEGERKLLDGAFQMRITRAFNDDPLRYEKEMIDDWLREEFSAPRK